MSDSNVQHRRVKISTFTSLKVVYNKVYLCILQCNKFTDKRFCFGKLDNLPIRNSLMKKVFITASNISVNHFISHKQYIKFHKEQK